MFATQVSIARVLVFFALPAFVITGCGESTPAPFAPTAPPPPPPPTSRPAEIVGTATLPIGGNGDLSNAMVGLYRDRGEWASYLPVVFVRVRGSGAQVSFTIANVVPGTYYLDVWKDTDNSARWSYGDFVGWYGNGSLGSPSLTPLQVREGESLDVGEIEMRLMRSYAQANSARESARLEAHWSD